MTRRPIGTRIRQLLDDPLGARQDATGKRFSRGMEAKQP